MRKTLSVALTLLGAASIGSCGGCEPAVGAVKSGSIAGSVLKGPVSGATVTAFAVTDAGRRAAALGEATTDPAGAFVVNVGGHSGPTLLCARDGIYTEEATGSLVQMGANELCTLIDDVELGANVEGVLITPWSSLHAELVPCFVELGREASVGSASQRAALRLNDFLSAGVAGYDFATTIPADVTTATGLSLSPETWAGVLTAGLSESAAAISEENDVAPGVRFTAVTLTAALRDDLAGGCVFDGVGRGGTALTQGVVALTADTLRGAPRGLATGISGFLAGARNTSGITPADVADVLRRLADHRSEIFADSGQQTDLEKPVLAFVTPAAASTRGGVVRVEVTAVDASAVPTFAFTAPTQATFLAAAPTCATDANGTTCTLVGSLNTSLEPVEDGPVTIAVTATDAAGNTETAELAFTANNSLPVINVSAPQEASVVDGTRTISATASDADGIESLTVSIPGVGVCSSDPGADLVDIEPATGILSCTWDTTRSPEGDVSLTFHAVDGAGQAAELSHALIVDNNAVAELHGFVDLGAPVVGATVTVFDFPGRVRGSVLGTTTTAEDGAFSVSIDDREHAALLVVATGGVFVDLATGGTFPIAEGQELTSAVAALGVGEVRTVNVNAWTTLAAARAAHTPVTTDDAFAVNANINLLSQHLRRVPLGAPFSVSTTRSADLTGETVTIADQRTVLALSHAALSRRAAELSVEAGVSVGTVTLVELVRGLALDLAADPLFDGTTAGDVLTIGPARVPLTSLATRFDLAAAMDRFIAEAPLLDAAGRPAAGANVDRNNSSITRADALNGRVYEALAEDNRGELYLDEGRPFDTVPPTIDLTFGGANQGAQPGASLRGVVQVNGLAADDASRVVVFDGTLRADRAVVTDDDPASERLRVFIGTDVLPNASAAAEACVDAPEASTVTDIGDAVCLCALAEDEQSNGAERILCFTRPLPTVAFEPPSPAPGSSVDGPVVVAARVTTGFDLAAFDVTGAATSLAPTRPTPDTLQVTVPTSFVDPANAPNIVVTAQATDVAGRTTPASMTFTRRPPSTSISAPAEGVIITSGQQVQLTGGATSGYDLASCTATLTSSPVQALPALPAPSRTGTACSFTTTLAATALPDATWTLTMSATDIVGRAATPVRRTFIVDDTAPTVTALALAGVTRTINTVGGNKFIAADDPLAALPRRSTYTATVTATDNFSISRVVFRVDTPGAGADLLFCVDGVAGACSSQSAVRVGGQLAPCTASNGCTIGGTKTGNSFSATIPDSRDDGARTVSVAAFDVNGNERSDGGGVVLNKDSVAPVFSWKAASVQDPWHDMAPTAGVQLCRSVDSGTDFRSSCISTPATQLVTNAFVGGAFFVGPTPTTPANTMHVWRNFIRATTLQTNGVALPTATAATVGDGTTTVRFQAGTTCPAPAALTKAKGLTNGGFVLNLALEDLGFDLAPVNATRICIRAVPVDAAGNEGSPADIFVKWDTVDPPLNVLVNPPFDDDPLAALAFSSAAADPRTFITGGKQVSMFHVFISNPYTFAEKVKLAPTADLIVDVTDTLSQHTQRSALATRWPGNATIQLQSPGSNIGRGPGNMTWSTTGLAASDDEAGNQLFVKVTTDSASDPIGTKVSDGAPSTGVVTRKNNIDRLDRAMVIDSFRFFSVDSTGLVGAELSPDAAGFISVPSATLSPGAFGLIRTASVVVAVAVGKVATGTQYRIAAPGESIPVMLRGTASTGVSPDITSTRFVVTRHPVFGSLNSVVNVETVSGFYLHAKNGDGTSGSPLLCGSSAARAECRFYKRWFELEELRLVWNVGDGTTLKKIFTLSTKDPANTVYTFSDTSALVPMHPAWTGFESDQQVLRTSVAPP
jgi:hypothetical protein